MTDRWDPDRRQSGPFPCNSGRLVVQFHDMITGLLLGRSETMWLEDSGYIGARRAFTAGGARLVPAPVNSERLDLDAGVEVDPTLR